LFCVAFDDETGGCWRSLPGGAGLPGGAQVAGFAMPA